MALVTFVKQTNAIPFVHKERSPEQRGMFHEFHAFRKFYSCLMNFEHGLAQYIELYGCVYRVRISLAELERIK